MMRAQQIEEHDLTQKAPPERRVKGCCVQKALLNPQRGDNYKLWDKIYNNNTYKALFIQAAESIHENNWNTLEGSDDCFYTYPDPTLFVNNLFSLSRTLVPDRDDIRTILFACQLPGKLPLQTLHGYSMIAPKPLIEEDIQKILEKFDQAQYRHAPPTQAQNCWNMRLLAGFITALGATAVAIALTLLTGTVATATTAAGVAAILTGVGLFAFGCCQPDSAAEKPAVAPVL